MKEKKMKKDERFISIIIIVFLIAILTFRVVSQGKKINRSLEDLEENENNVSFSSPQEENNQKEESISLDNDFVSPDNKLSFSYPSEWREMENEDVLDIFNPISEEESNQNSFDLNSQDLEKLEEITIDDEDSDIDSEIIFLAMKSKIPQFSLGIISVQKLNLQENTISNLETVMEDKFEKEENNSYSQIIKKEKGDYFISMEVVTYVNERPTFKSNNLGLINEEDIFLITLNSANENWEDFKNEFNMIISSIQLNKDE